MNSQSVNHIAAEIVGKAAFAALDCNAGALAAHVVCAYDVWLNDVRGTRQERLVYTDDFKVAVRNALFVLGFPL